ncbi:hypothetical protein O181_058595 [Austropuccinia psidii MF-1]|uniref:Retropepsins domain-containing protein n=1 Tax=Austropuccinia psidii MF-1 TaxID=1389203 RepID=A0A9Q3EA05_9BASI|nr:hypothetical protein [Austropuccinia psidii MF-1]
MKRRWGTVSPERRYRLSSITELFTKTQQEDGIRNMTQYGRFIWEYEAIITYIQRYQYIQGDMDHNQEILACLLTSVQELIYKEMIKDRAIPQALDGDQTKDGKKIPKSRAKKERSYSRNLYLRRKKEERVIIPTKFQNSNIPKPDQPEEEIENISNKNEDEEIFKEEKKFIEPQKKKVENKLEIDKIIEKIIQKKINLTIEEILRMSPNFVHKLQELSEKDEEKIKSLNSIDIQERLLTFESKEIPKPKIHYSCPLGFMEIFIGKEEYPIKALVDTVAECNIINEEIALKYSLKTRNLNMKLREIGGHTTSLVALSEFTPIILASGEETQIHFFIAKGLVHIVLGRPFLADNNIRL